MTLSQPDGKHIGFGTDLDVTGLTVVRGTQPVLTNEGLKVVLRARTPGDFSSLSVQELTATGGLLDARVPKAELLLKTGTGENAKAVPLLQRVRAVGHDHVPELAKIQAIQDAMSPPEAPAGAGGRVAGRRSPRSADGHRRGRRGDGRAGAVAWRGTWFWRRRSLPGRSAVRASLRARRRSNAQAAGAGAVFAGGSPGGPAGGPPGAPAHGERSAGGRAVLPRPPRRRVERLRGAVP